MGTKEVPKETAIILQRFNILSEMIYVTLTSLDKT